MQHAAADRDDSSDSSLCRAVRLVRVRNRGLLLDAFFFVEVLERVGRKLTSSVVPHKLDLLAELLLHLLMEGMDLGHEACMRRREGRRRRWDRSEDT
ncbi:hypothetical protein PC116_g34846 [Phytophthora cactorum]|nr:hypothetical protein PC116_g34846 [Phytophthora cactorum]